MTARPKGSVPYVFRESNRLTAMKTLTMYLRAAKTEAEDAGVATDGMANSVSELRQGILDLTGQQVDIMLDDETFKSTFQIMQEISRVWKEMSDTSRSNLLNMIGGKRNANMFAALIENFAQAEKAADAAMGALGSATVENWQYLDSIEGKIATLTASFQELSASVLDSELIKWGVDALTLVTQFATFLSDIGALIPTITAGLLAFDATKQLNKVKNAVSEFRDLLDAHTNGDKVDGEGLGSAINASLSGYTDILKRQYVQLLQNSDAFTTLDGKTQAAILSQIQLQKASEETATGLAAVGKEIGNVWNSLSGVGKISLVLNILSVIYSIYRRIVDDQSEKNEAALEAADKLVTSYQNETAKLEEQKKALSELKDEYQQLASGVDDDGSRGSLTEEQYSRYLQLVEQIVSISPDVVEVYNDEGEAVKLYAEALQTAIAEQDRLLENQRQMLVANGSALYEDNLSNYKKAVEEAQKSFGEVLISDSVLQDTVRKKAGAYAGALSEAFNEIGIQVNAGAFIWDGGIWSSNFSVGTFSEDVVRKVHENSEAFVAKLKESNAYTAEQIVEIEAAMYNVSQLLQKVDEFELQQVEYLKAYTQGQEWYDELTPASLDEFESGLLAINDPLKSYAVNAAAAAEYGRQFVDGLHHNNASSEFASLAEGVKDGSVTLDDYKQKVSEFIDSLIASGVVTNDVAANSLREYFMSLIKSAEAYNVANDGAKSYVQSLENISAAMQSFEKHADVLKKAREEMAAMGTISPDTFSDMLGMLDDGENILDYLDVENGKLRLNEEAWQKRNETKAEGMLSGLEQEAADLQAILDKETAGEEYVLPIDYESIDAVRERFELLTQTIAKIKEAGDLGDEEIDLGLTDMQTELDTLVQKASTVQEMYDGILKGVAVSQEDIFSLMTDMPELSAALAGAGSIEEQKAILEQEWAEYEALWDKIINDQLAILRGRLAGVDSSTEEYSVLSGVIDGLEKMRDFDLSGMTPEVKEVEKSFASLADTIDAAGKAADFRLALTDGDTSPLEMIEQAQEMAEDLNGILHMGRDDWSWTDFTFDLTKAGSLADIEWSDDKIRAYTDAMIDSYVAASNLGERNPELVAELKELAYQAATTEASFASLSDALGAIDQAQAFRLSLAEGKTGVLDLIEQAQTMAEDLNEIGYDIDWTAFTQQLDSTSSLGDIQWNEEALRAYSDAMIDSYLSTTKLAETNPELVQELKETAYQATEAAQKIELLTKAMDKAQSATSVYESIQEDLKSGSTLSLDTMSSLIDLVGKEWTSLVDITSEGFTLKAGADIGKWFETYIDNLVKTEAYQKEFGEDAAKFAEGLKATFNASLVTPEDGAPSFDSYTTLQERLEQTAEFYNLLAQAQQDVIDNGALSADTLQSFISTFGSKDWMKYVSFDGKDFLPNITELEAEIDRWINGLDFSALGDDAEAVKKALKDMFKFEPDSMQDLDDVLSKVDSAANLLADIQSEIGDTGTNSLESLQSLIGLMGEHWTEAVTFTENGFNIQAQAVKNYVMEAINALDVEEELKDKMQAALDVAVEKASAYDALSSAMDRISTASSLLTDIQSNEGDPLSMLRQAAKMAEESETSISDFVKVVGDDLVWSEEAITEWATKSVDALSEYTEITPELRGYLIELAVAEVQATTSAEKMALAYEKANAALAGMPNRGDLVALTYESYSELIKTDKRYAAAVEYQNGILTLNRDIYAGLTDDILNEIKAQALANMQATLTGDAYTTLIGKLGNLSDEEQQRLADLNAEIMGYQVLISEIDNANDAYARFLRASTETESSRYAAVKSALQVIQDTLINAESDIYGRVGREQYISAIQLLIDPEIEVGTEAFDEARKTIERYVADDISGVQNFYDDLVANGFIDSNRNLAGSAEEMASRLGISMSLLRAMIDELNEYQTEDNQIKVDFDSGDVEKETKTAEQQLAELQQMVTSLNTDLDLNHEITVQSDAAVNAVGAVSSAVSTLISKLYQLGAMRVAPTVSVVQTTTSAVGSTYTSSSNKVHRVAMASGTNFAPGGRTLVGELGPETVVDPNTNSWYTVGRNGAEFVNLPKGAIVFNAQQTADLFNSGRIASRGRAMVAGSELTKAHFVDRIGSSAERIVASIAQAAAEGAAQGVEYVSGGGLDRPGGAETETSNRQSGGKSQDEKIKDLADAYEEANSYLEHLIRHQEHLYEVAENGMDFAGMETSLTEQARLYRQIMAESKQTVDAMIAAGADDTDEALQKVEETYWASYTNLYDILQQMNDLYVDALQDKIDSIQSSFDSFTSMIDEINQDGSMTVDTFQKLTSQGLQFLNYMELVDGQYVINREALEELLAAQTEQLAIEQALAYVAQIKQALVDQDTEKLDHLIDLTNEIGNSTWDLVYANAALLKSMGLDDDQYAAMLHNLDMLRSMSSQINTGLNDSTGEYGKQSNALDEILEYTKDLIRYETDNRIEALEAEIDAYQELIDQRKEALKLAREEEDYNKSIKDQTEEIAQLRARIAQLSLDDSREARAERAGLEDELLQLQNNLADAQGDHAYEVQTGILDKSAEEYAAAKQQEIKLLEESISSEEKLYQAALMRISTGWDTLYSDLINWNMAAGNALNSEITEAWKAALDAAEEYGTYAEAIVANTGNPMATVLSDAEEISDSHSVSQRTGLYRIVDFAKELSAKLGSAVGNLSLPSLDINPAFAGAGTIGGTIVTNDNAFTFSPVINVQIGSAGDLTTTTARSYGREIGEIAMQELKEAFVRRGVPSILNNGLKQ